MNAKQIVGLIGSVIVLVGCFLPIAHVPIYGGMNYMFPPGGGIGDGVIVACIALLGLLGATRGSSLVLLLSSVLAVLVFGYTLSKLFGVFAESREAGGIAGALFSSAKIGVGAAAISVGILLMFVASALPKAKQPEPDDSLVKCPSCAEKIQAEARKCRFCGEALTHRDDQRAA